MKKRDIREAREAKRRKRRQKNTLMWGGLGLIGLIVVGFLAWNALRPAAGEAMPVLSRDHVAEDLPLEAFNSDPPTSGAHYANNLPADFYHESDLARLPANPEGYLVHNLEHGYSIFWYNCELLEEAGCTELKGQIQAIMDEFNGFKLIAFPRATIDFPLVMTSWGRMQKFDAFSAANARQFIVSNRNRAPEPNAP